MGKLAIVGTGVMGEAIIAGLLRAGWDAAQIVAVDRHSGKLAQLSRKYGVAALPLPTAVGAADTVIVAVKPQDAQGVFPQLGEFIRWDALVISLCAGVNMSQIAADLPRNTPIIRAMPNIPTQVGEGMSAISVGDKATAAHLQYAVDLLSALGETSVVPEKYQDAIAAVSGSGPAYFFLVAEAMIDAGVMLGLPRDISTALVRQTMLGSAKLLVESNEYPGVLREKVIYPGGATAAAQRKLEDHRVKAVFMEAMEAARDRSAALANRD